MLWCLLTTYRKLCKLNWAFQRTHYWIPTIQDGWHPPSWKSTWRHFFCRGWSDLDKISQTGTEWHVDCGDVWKWKPDIEFQYGGRLGEFNGIIIIPEPRITLQGAATWWIHCHHSRATRHIAGCSHRAKSMSWSCHIAGCKNSIRHILKLVFAIFYFFLFLMQFRLWRATAFVSSPIHLFKSVLLCLLSRSLACHGEQGVSVNIITEKTLTDVYKTYCVGL